MPMTQETMNEFAKHVMTGAFFRQQAKLAAKRTRTKHPLSSIRPLPDANISDSNDSREATPTGFSALFASSRFSRMLAEVKELKTTRFTLPINKDPQLSSEGIFRLLVDSVLDYAIFMLDGNGNVQSWNAGAERIKGYKPEEIIGKHFSIFYPAEDLAKGKPAYELARAIEVGSFQDENWRVRKNGSRFWANVLITKVVDGNGNFIGFGKVTRDLTERRIAEQRYRRLIDGVTDYAIFSLDVNGNVTGWNSGAERIKGYPDFEIIGQHFSKFYTPEDIAKNMPAQTLRTAIDEGHFAGEGWRVRKDGTRFWASVVVTPVRNDDGELTGFSKVTRDVTDRKILMDRLQEHARELELRVAEREQTVAELESFSYSISHDLRGPLRAIRGYTEILLEDYGNSLDPTAQKYLEEVVGASEKMTRLIEDLLNYSRLSRAELQLASVSVHDVVQTSASNLPPDSGKLIISIATDLHVLAHYATLVQALVNLFDNALKFHSSERPAQVLVTAQPKDGLVRISVADNGVGIAPQHLERIFGVFERLHTIDAFPGTGVGLAIVKRSVERMGGAVGVQSTLGQGSTFWLELPLSHL
jgi:PAS domain S-box-containing protein